MKPNPGKPIHRYALCIIFLFLAFSLKAQERTILSYSFYSPKDSAAVFALVKQGLVLLDQTPEQAMALFQKAEQLSKSSGFDDGAGYALGFMGLTAGQLGDHEKSRAYYKEGLAYCLRARECKFVIAFLYMNIGLSWKEKGDYTQANEYFHKALASFQQYLPGDKSMTAVYINLIGIQARMGSYALALSYADQAIQLAEKNNQLHFLALAQLNKGNTFYTMKQPDSALHYYNTGLKTAEKIKDKKLYASFYLSLGNNALQNNDNANAVRYLNQVISLYQKETSGTLFGYILPRYSLGLAYSRLKEYKKAEQVLLEGLGKARLTGLTENEHDGHGVLADVYEATGRYKEAMQQATIFQTLMDSAQQVRKIKAINEIEIKYRTTQKDKDLLQKKMMIARQEKAIGKRNIVIATTAGGLLLVLAGSFLFYRYNKKMALRNAEISRLKAIAAGEEQERGRISRELHDGLGGMITGIKMNLHALQKQEDTSMLPRQLDGIMLQLQGMGEEIRKTAHNLMPDALQEQDLQQALQLYCNQLQTGQQQIRLQFHGRPDIADKSLALTLYRIVQELVQNIVKHSGATLAEIQVIHNKDTVCISAEDNGRGFDNKKGSGSGLQNIKTRVDALNGYYSVTSVPGKGTTAFIEIDLKNSTG